MIVLLDLNYTLVANSVQLRGRGPEYRQKHEQYRTWLIDLIKTMRPELTCIVTIRGEEDRAWTLKHLEEVTGWQPDRAYFNTLGNVTPPVWKRHVLANILIPEFGADPQRYLPIESNQDTHKMYGEFGIVGLKAFPANEGVRENGPDRDRQRSMFD